MEAHWTQIEKEEYNKKTASFPVLILNEDKYFIGVLCGEPQGHQLHSTEAENCTPNYLYEACLILEKKGTEEEKLENTEQPPLDDRQNLSAQPLNTGMAMAMSANTGMHSMHGMENSLPIPMTKPKEIDADYFFANKTFTEEEFKKEMELRKEDPEAYDKKINRIEFKPTLLDKLNKFNQEVLGIWVLAKFALAITIAILIPMMLRYLFKLFFLYHT